MLDFIDKKQETSAKFERPQKNFDDQLAFLRKFFSLFSNKAIYHLILFVFLILPIAPVLDYLGVQKVGLSGGFISLAAVGLILVLWVLRYLFVVEKFQLHFFRFSKLWFLPLGILLLGFLLSLRGGLDFEYGQFFAKTGYYWIFLSILFIFFFLDYINKGLLEVSRRGNETYEKNKTIISYLKLVLAYFFVGNFLLSIAAVLFYFFAPGHFADLYQMSGMILVSSLLFFIFANTQKYIFKYIWFSLPIINIFIFLFFGATNILIFLSIVYLAVFVFKRIFFKEIFKNNFYAILLSLVSFAVIFVSPYVGQVNTDQLTYDQEAVSQVRGSIFNFSNNFYGNSFLSFAHVSLFGAGAGNAEIISAVTTINEIEPNYDFKEKFVEKGINQIFLDYGIFGFLSALILLIFLIYQSIKQIIKNNSIVKTEWNLLPLVGIVSAVLGLWLLPFSPFYLWSFVFVLVFYLAAQLQYKKVETITIIDLSNGSVRKNIAKACVVLVILFYIFEFTLGTKYVLALGKSHSASEAFNKIQSEFDPKLAQESVELYAKSYSLNSKNEYTGVSYARSLVYSVTDQLSIVEQKEILDKASLILANLSENSTNGYVHWQIGRTYLDMERLAIGSILFARLSYQKAQKFLPKNLSLALESAGFYRENINDLAGEVLTVEDLRKESKQNIERALALDSAFIPLVIELALLTESSDGAQKAISILTPFENTNADAAYQLGRLYFNEGRIDLAKEKFIQVTKSFPEHSNAHYSLGIIYYRTGEYAKALAEFEETLRLNPESRDVREKLLEVSSALNQ